MPPKKSPVAPYTGGFNPDKLEGSALMCIAHSSLQSKNMVALPSTMPLLTYTNPGENMKVSDAQAALEKMAKERRIVKNVGKFHVRPNCDVTPNYELGGDDRIGCVGLYKIVPKKGVEHLERWRSHDETDVEGMYSLAKVHGCTSVVILACKS